MSSNDENKPDFKNFKDLTAAPHFHDKKPWARQEPESENPVFENKNPGVTEFKYIYYLASLGIVATAVYWGYFSILELFKFYIEPWINITLLVISTVVIVNAAVSLLLGAAYRAEIKSYFEMYSDHFSFYSIANDKIRMNIDDIDSITYYPAFFPDSAYFKFKNFYGDQFFVSIQNYPIFFVHLKNNKHFRPGTEITKKYSFRIGVFTIAILSAFFYLERSNDKVFENITWGLFAVYALASLGGLFFKLYSKLNLIPRRSEVLFGSVLFAGLMGLTYKFNFSKPDKFFNSSIKKIAFFQQQGNQQFRALACSDLIGKLSYQKRLPQWHKLEVRKSCSFPQPTRQVSSESQVQRTPYNYRSRIRR